MRKNGKLSPVILYLTLSDIFVWGSSTVGAPLLAIYLSSKFGGLTVEYIGIGTAVYFLVRGLTQLPLGTLTDKIKTDHDEIALLILGCLLMAFPYLIFPSVKAPGEYYLLQAIAGLGASLNLNNWRKLFAKNLGHHREGFEYGIYETVMSLSTALLGLAGGFTSSINAQVFEIVIVIIGGLIAFGGLISAAIYGVTHRKSEFA